MDLRAPMANTNQGSLLSWAQGHRMPPQPSLYAYPLIPPFEERPILVTQRRPGSTDLHPYAGDRNLMALGSQRVQGFMKREAGYTPSAMSAGGNLMYRSQKAQRALEGQIRYTPPGTSAGSNLLYTSYGAQRAIKREAAYAPSAMPVNDNVVPSFQSPQGFMRREAGYTPSAMPATGNATYRSLRAQRALEEQIRYTPSATPASGNLLYTSYRAQRAIKREAGYAPSVMSVSNNIMPHSSRLQGYMKRDSEYMPAVASADHGLAKWSTDRAAVENSQIPPEPLEPREIQKTSPMTLTERLASFGTRLIPFAGSFQNKRTPSERSQQRQKILNRLSSRIAPPTDINRQLRPPTRQPSVAICSDSMRNASPEERELYRVFPNVPPPPTRRAVHEPCRPALTSAIVTRKCLSTVQRIRAPFPAYDPSHLESASRFVGSASTVGTAGGATQLPERIENRKMKDESDNLSNLDATMTVKEDRLQKLKMSPWLGSSAPQLWFRAPSSFAKEHKARDGSRSPTPERPLLPIPLQVGLPKRLGQFIGRNEQDLENLYDSFSMCTRLESRIAYLDSVRESAMFRSKSSVPFCGELGRDPWDGPSKFSLRCLARDECVIGDPFRNSEEETRRWLHLGGTRYSLENICDKRRCQPLNSLKYDVVVVRRSPVRSLRHLKQRRVDQAQKKGIQQEALIVPALSAPATSMVSPRERRKRSRRRQNKAETPECLPFKAVREVEKKEPETDGCPPHHAQCPKEDVARSGTATPSTTQNKAKPLDVSEAVGTQVVFKQFSETSASLASTGLETSARLRPRSASDSGVQARKVVVSVADTRQATQQILVEHAPADAVKAASPVPRALVEYWKSFSPVKVRSQGCLAPVATNRRSKMSTTPQLADILKDPSRNPTRLQQLKAIWIDTAVRTIQTFWRQKLSERREASAENAFKEWKAHASKAAVRIQTAFRGYRARKAYKQLQESRETEARKNAMACRIQRAWRRHRETWKVQRAQLTELLYTLRQDAATTIQKTWRGYKTREFLKLQLTNWVITWHWDGPGNVVEVVGDFTTPQWTKRILMTWNAIFSQYAVVLPRIPGRHEIKFVVNGKYCCDGSLPVVADGGGHYNNVIKIENNGSHNLRGKSDNDNEAHSSCGEGVVSRTSDTVA